MPALLARISMPPSPLVTCSTMRPTACLSVTSLATAMALTPRAQRSATAAFDFSSLRPTTAMAAPASARPRAMPSPMPPLPPVTMATLPFRSNSAGFIAALSKLSSLALPDQDQADGGQRCAVAGPLDFIDHEAALRPRHDAGALADPEQADGERKQANDEKCSAHRVSSWPGA